MTETDTPPPPPQPPYPVRLPGRFAEMAFVELPRPMQERVLTALQAAGNPPDNE